MYFLLIYIKQAGWLGIRQAGWQAYIHTYTLFYILLAQLPGIAREKRQELMSPCTISSVNNLHRL